MKIKNTIYLHNISENLFIERLHHTNKPIYIRYGNFSTEILVNNNLYVLPPKQINKRKSIRNEIFIFNLVRNDAKQFLKKKNYTIKLPKQEPAIFYNKNFVATEKTPITATDLDHAYWRIAFNLGIISEKTYKTGLNLKSKEIRLASLSTIGMGKEYSKINTIKKGKNSLILNRDETLMNVYKLIRYTCYKYMRTLSKKLGKDFIGYKTDCIYYKKTNANIKLVNDFFEKNNLLCKQLHEKTPAHAGDKKQVVIKKTNPNQRDFRSLKL
jgi:hypothetical protein